MSDDETDPLVYVIDDDQAVRESLGMLFSSVRIEARGFPDPERFLAELDTGRPGCIVCDIRMPGMSGLQLQRRLHEDGVTLPLLFITGHGDVPMAVAAMREGALDFLQKPLDEERLLERVHEALAGERERHANAQQRDRIRQRFDQLTERERQVMQYLLRGEANKVIAAELGISPRTVELHRTRVLGKMAVRNVTELVHAASQAELRA